MNNPEQKSNVIEMRHYTESQSVAQPVQEIETFWQTLKHIFTGFWFGFITTLIAWLVCAALSGCTVSVRLDLPKFGAGSDTDELTHGDRAELQALLDGRRG